MKYTFTKISKESLDKAMNDIRKAGGTVSDSGFSIRGVAGRYKLEEGLLTIVVDDKPWLASWDMIEEKLSEYFMQ